MTPNEINLARVSPLGWGVVTSRPRPDAEPRWKPYPHAIVIDRRLRRLADADDPLNRLVVILPPQHGKSLFISEIFSTWYLGTNPHHVVAVVSYIAAKARKVGARCRHLFSRYARPVFGVDLDRTSSAKEEWSVADHSGFFMSTGIEGRLTGERIDLMIVDDLFKNYEQAMSPYQRDKVWDWLTGTALSRVHETGLIVFVNTRWHPEDVIGRLLRQHMPTITGSPVKPQAIAA